MPCRCRLQVHRSCNFSRSCPCSLSIGSTQMFSRQVDRGGIFVQHVHRKDSLQSLAADGALIASRSPFLRPSLQEEACCISYLLRECWAGEANICMPPIQSGRCYICASKLAVDRTSAFKMLTRTSRVSMRTFHACFALNAFIWRIRQEILRHERAHENRLPCPSFGWKFRAPMLFAFRSHDGT